MSRIGRLPVAIPAGVEVSIAEGNVVTVKGPKGTLERALPTEMEIKVEDGHVVEMCIRDRCTPWGKPALGLKTRKKNKQSNKLIVRRRDGKALSK